jgi:hypothetical protein
MKKVNIMKIKYYIISELQLRETSKIGRCNWKGSLSVVTLMEVCGSKWIDTRTQARESLSLFDEVANLSHFPNLITEQHAILFQFELP